jgi:hypothetical protein
MRTVTLDPKGWKEIPSSNLIDDLEKETCWNSIAYQENIVFGQPSPTVVIKPCPEIQPNQETTMSVQGCQLW